MTKLTHSPYARTMGFDATRDDRGRLILSMPADPGKRGRPGFLHGGAIAGLLEVAGYAALDDALDGDASVRIKPVNITVSYMRGATEQTCFAAAHIDRLGKRVANVEVTAWQDDESRPVAMAQMNLMIDRSGTDQGRDERSA
jgi:uncharacterized protein (TIGR00369 family)